MSESKQKELISLITKECNKKELREEVLHHLHLSHLADQFPSRNFDDTGIDYFNSCISKFKKELITIDSIRTYGIGPGELLFCFLFDNIGFDSSNSVDLTLNGEPWVEMKFGSYSNNYLTDFKITPDNAIENFELLTNISELNRNFFSITNEPLPDFNTLGEISGVKINNWRKICFFNLDSILLSLHTKTGDLKLHKSNEYVGNIFNKLTILQQKCQQSLFSEMDYVQNFNQIEEKWINNIYESYIKNKKFIILDKKMKIRHYGFLLKSQLSLHRITRSQPKIKISKEKESS